VQESSFIRERYARKGLWERRVILKTAISEECKCRNIPAAEFNTTQVIVEWWVEVIQARAYENLRLSKIAFR